MQWALIKCDVAPVSKTLEKMDHGSNEYHHSYMPCKVYDKYNIFQQILQKGQLD
jgi:hypothetical protein